ncbi:MAG: SH3 domain-containing protein [Anaerolineales bacterium]
MKKIVSLALASGLFLSSCNLPGLNTPDPQIATAAALTVQAVINITPSAKAKPTATLPVNVEATPTPSQPVMASVADVTNCRTGPGVNYERVTQILPKDTVEIVGFSSLNYWVVSTSFGPCWLSAEFVTPSGNVSAVPTVTAPPTSTGNAPEAATFPKNGWTFFCDSSGQADITLAWNDKATNETGYRVLRNGEVAAELPANSTYFSETITLVSGQSVGYQIQSYNLAGEANSTVATMTCP